MSGSHPGPEFEGPRFDGPARAEPDFRPCYLHPDRQTGITCQRCHRPICMQCMNEASVGFHCPECAGRTTGHDDRGGRRRVGSGGGGSGRLGFGRPGGGGSRPASGSGIAARLQIGDSPVTWALCGIAALLAVVDVLTGQLVLTLFGIAPTAVASGQLWRLLTYAVTSYPILGLGLLTLAISVLVMVMIGRALEPALGRGRFLAVYLTGALAGGALFTALGPGGIVAYGFSAGVLGMIAANAVLKLRLGADIRGDLLLLGILIVFNLFIGFSSMIWLLQLGAALGAGGATAVLSHPRLRRNTRGQVLGVAGVWVACLAVAAVRIVL